MKTLKILDICLLFVMILYTLGVGFVAIVDGSFDHLVFFFVLLIYLQVIWGRR